MIRGLRNHAIPTVYIWRGGAVVCVWVRERGRKRERERERGRKRAWARGSFLTLPHNRFTLPSESLFHLKRLVSLQWTIATAQQGAEESHYFKLPFVKTTVTKKSRENSNRGYRRGNFFCSHPPAHPSVQPLATAWTWTKRVHLCASDGRVGPCLFLHFTWTIVCSK